MKILQINSVCGVGSTGRIATDLYKELRTRGYECKIAFGRGDAPEDIQAIKIGNIIDNYVHVFNTRLFDKHGLSSNNATQKFIKEIEMYNPDIIHLHNIHGYYINIEILFSYLKKINKPVVWTLHDCWAFTGHCCYFEYAGCEKWKYGCDNCSQLIEYPTSKLFDRSRLNYQIKKKLFLDIDNLHIVVVSEWLKNIINQSFFKDINIIKIMNGIDTDCFKPKLNLKLLSKYKLNDRRIILGVANVWDKRKGLDDFIELSKIIDEKYKIILVGLTDKQISKLPKNIIGIKRTENISELVELYSIADVFVNMSVEETFGLVNIEAMACGTPVVAYNCSAIPETINYKCGYIVEKNDINNLYIAIESIISNKQHNWSKSCRDWVVENYNKDNCYENYIQLYEKIINNRL